MKLKKIISFTLLFIILISTTSFAVENTDEINSTILKNNINQTVGKTANQNETDLKLFCESCILVECSTQKTAYEKNSEKKIYPASTTKLLTAVITLDKCNLTDTVTITNEMVNGIPPGYTIAYLQPGETYTIEELLNLLLIPSANDAGYALAIHMSGSIANFANVMNETAKSFGCTNSNFTNPSGIHNVNHYSTARDLSLISLNALRYTEIVEIGSKTQYTIHGKTFETTNTLIKPNEPNYYEHATGLKTGFTDQAGSCIIATAKKDNMQFIAIVLNSPKPSNGMNYRDIDCKNLFEYGFNHYDEIIPSIDSFLSRITNIIFGGKILENVVKIICSFLIVFLVFSILKKRDILKNKLKNTEINIKDKNNKTPKNIVESTKINHNKNKNERFQDNKINNNNHKYEKSNYNEFNFKCLNW